MPAKNYSNRKKQKNTGNNSGVVGVILILVSVFLLICIIFPKFLSVISEWISTGMLAFLGFVSIPVLVCTLILGIALVRNLRPAISGKYIALIVTAVISAIMIFHLASTRKFAGSGIDDYISEVAKGNTIGGLLFGIIVYGIQKVLTEIGTYILLSLVTIACLFLLFADVFSTNKNKRMRKDDKPKGFVKGSSKPSLVQPVSNNGLFVDTIVPSLHRITSESGSFDDIMENPKPQLSKYDSGGSAEFEKYHSGEDEASERKFKSEAHRILFADNNVEKYLPNNWAEYKGSGGGKRIYDNSADSQLENYKQYTSNYIPNGKSDIRGEVQTASAATAGAERQPGKGTGSKYGLQEIVMPVSKNYSDKYIAGPIINGEEMSAEVRTSDAEDSKKSFFPDNTAVVAPYSGDDSAKRDLRSGIINGDSYNDYVEQQKRREKEDAKRAEQAKKESQRKSDSELNTFGRRPTETDFEKLLLAERAIMNSFNNRYREEDATRPEKAEAADPEASSEFEDESSLPREDISASDFDYDTGDGVAFDDTDVGETYADETDDELDSAAGSGNETSEDFSSRYVPGDIISGSSGLVISQEDALDMSETSDPSSFTDTGYYETDDGENTEYVSPEDFDNNKKGKFETVKINDFSENAANIEHSIFTKNTDFGKKLKPENQVNIDEYLTGAAPQEKPVIRKRKSMKYNPPPIDLLLNNSTDPNEYGEDCEKNAMILEDTLKSLKFPAKVIGITKGPAVTRYELETPPGIPIKRVENCAKDIAYALASEGKIRIETPIPGRRAVGIEVPNEKIAIVGLKEIIESKEFTSSVSSLTLALGKDITGHNIVCNLEKMPHLLIAGSTGSGKSACLNSIITSILYKASPEDVRLILIDPKQVEFVVYRDMPHLLIKNIITEPTQAINAFKWAKSEMERRYKAFSKYAIRNLQDYNNSKYVREGQEPKLPYIVIIVDELSDLMMSNNRKEIEDKIMSMAQKARAAGIHLILATQRPSVDVITGTIKANLPSRIAFSVASIHDSRTILDQSGAEALLGRGDMLYSPLDSNDPKRVQGAYITSDEVTDIVEYVKEYNQFDYDDAAEEEIMKTEEEKREDETSPEESIFDPLMPDAVRRVIETGQASTSMIQRRFSVGYARAARIMDQMEMHNFVGPSEGARPREVYITREQFREIFGEDV